MPTHYFEKGQVLEPGALQAEYESDEYQAEMDLARKLAELDQDNSVMGKFAYEYGSLYNQLKQDFTPEAQAENAQAITQGAQDFSEGALPFGTALFGREAAEGAKSVFDTAVEDATPTVLGTMGEAFPVAENIVTEEGIFPAIMRGITEVGQGARDFVTDPSNPFYSAFEQVAGPEGVDALGGTINEMVTSPQLPQMEPRTSAPAGGTAATSQAVDDNAVVRSTSQENPLGPAATETIKKNVREGSPAQQEQYRKIASGMMPGASTGQESAAEIDKGTWDNLSTDTKAHLVALGVGALASGLGANNQFMSDFTTGFSGARQSEAQARQAAADRALRANLQAMQQEEGQLDRESRERVANIGARSRLAAAQSQANADITKNLDKQLPTRKELQENFAALLKQSDPGASDWFPLNEMSEDEINQSAIILADEYNELPAGVRRQISPSQWLQLRQTQ